MTENVIWFGRDPRGPVHEASTESRPRHSTGETILLVEDQDDVRVAAQRVLERFGYQVLTASSGREALCHYRAHRDSIALVLTDVLMPEMGGWELCLALRAEGLAAPVLFTSGYAGFELKDQVLGLGTDVPLLQKPWTASELLDAVDRALAGPGAE